ncbi:MAG: RNA polymerase sigma factor region1.1 domain-containing protein, partial [Betaproteobacteria bacterium]
MPTAKSSSKSAAPSNAKPTAKPAAKVASKAATKPSPKEAAKTVDKVAAKSGSKPAQTVKNAQASERKTEAASAATKPAAKVAAQAAGKTPAKKQAELKTGKLADPQVPAKKPAAAKEPAAKKGKGKDLPKPAAEEDLSDIEAEFAEEPVVAESTEKAKPLRMKISKAKERALMKEFGLDETVLSEEDMLKRRQRLKTLIKLGKTRGYLTHGEISDHLPDKLVDAETLEVVVNMLNDMGVAVYEQAPDAETLLLNNTGPTVATEEEAEEEAEAALSTVDSEFGRTTDPVRMYMREMGTVDL